jgi:hypothetical protein
LEKLIRRLNNKIPGSEKDNKKFNSEQSLDAMMPVARQHPRNQRHPQFSQVPLLLIQVERFKPFVAADHGPSKGNSA